MRSRPCLKSIDYVSFDAGHGPHINTKQTHVEISFQPRRSRGRRCGPYTRWMFHTMASAPQGTASSRTPPANNYQGSNNIKSECSKPRNTLAGAVDKQRVQVLHLV